LIIDYGLFHTRPILTQGHSLYSYKIIYNLDINQLFKSTLSSNLI